MNTITTAQIRQAIAQFLDNQYQKKSDKEQKQLQKAQEKNDLATIAELSKTLAAIRAKYELDNWLKEAEKMAKQLNFGTHISKGIHSDAKGDNIIFTEKPAHGYAGTHSLHHIQLDANGNAAALPLAAFFEQPVTESHTLRDVILSQTPALQGCFAADSELSQHYQDIFYQCLSSQPETPSTHERNKQILWPIEPDSDSYHTLVPLHPSALSHHIANNINERRWSEAAKTARENRKHPNKEQAAYQDLIDLATVQLGGTKPQNISLLNSRQGGRQYLLPSLPPLFQAQGFRLSPSDTSLFQNRAYGFQMRFYIEQLLNVMEQERNNVHIRDYRDSLIADMLAKTFAIASELQQQPAGWSEAFGCLNFEQTLWLDPDNPDTEFQEDRLAEDWQNEIESQFAAWLQNSLQTALAHSRKVKPSSLAAPEFQHWKDAIHQAIEASKCLSEGVFQ